MSKNYSCEICDKHYKSYMGYWLHNKKKHNKNIIVEPVVEDIINEQIGKTEKTVNDIKKKIYACRKCNKILSCKQSRWKHEKTCTASCEITLEEKVNQLTEKVNTLEKTPKNIINNNTTNNNTTNNNTTNNIQYIINSPSASSIGHLTFELQKDILDKGLNSLVYLIEMINFNELVPENHSYCVTAINDKHASVIDEKTNTIIKTNKFDLFDRVLGANLANLEKIASNPKFTKAEKAEYQNKIDYLKKTIFQNTKFIKRYQSDINLMSYNKKDMVQETWCVFSKAKATALSLKSLKDINENPEQEQPKGFDDLIDELPDDEKPDWLKPKNKSKPRLIDFSDSEDSTLSSDSESDEKPDNKHADKVEIEIKINNNAYIVNGINLFDKKTGDLYGTYINGKIKKIQQNKDIEI